METLTLNEEELLSEKLEKVVEEYYENPWNEVKRQALLQVLQNNNCRAGIAKCGDGDKISNAFIRSGFHNHCDILEAFLHHGMNIDIKNQHGWTSLMYASYHGQQEIVQLLLDHNASADLKDKYGKTALDFAKTEEIKKMIQNHVNTSYILK